MKRPLIALLGLLVFSAHLFPVTSVAADPLTLVAALQAAEENHPGLQALKARLNMLDAEARQAGVRPNPALEAEAENLAGSGEFSGTDSAEYTIRLSQPVLLGGKRSKRAAAAGLERTLEEWNLERMRRHLVSEVTGLCTRLLAGKERVALADEMLKLSDELEQMAGRRVESGGGSELEWAKARIEQASAGARLVQAELELEGVQRELALLLGVGHDGAVNMRGDLYRRWALPEWSVLEASLQNHPARQQATVAIEHREALATLAETGRVPDVDLGVGWKRDEGADSQGWVLSAGIPLPIFDRNRDGRDAAAYQVEVAELDQQVLERALTRELIRVHEAWLGAERQVDLLEKTMIPEARKAFDWSRTGYEQGRFGQLELLDAQHTLFESRGRLIDALEASRLAAAGIAQLTGLNVTDHF